AVGGLLEQRLDVGGHRLLALRDRAGGAEPRLARQPFLELVVEAVLRLSCLDVEKAQDERAGEAEQRRAEGRAHGAERRRQAALEIVEGGGRIAAAHAEPADHLADRADGLDKAAEGAEQAEQHEKTDEIARYVASLVETAADRIEQRAHRGRRQAK